MDVLLHQRAVIRLAWGQLQGDLKAIHPSFADLETETCNVLKIFEKRLPDFSAEQEAYALVHGDGRFDVFCVEWRVQNNSPLTIL
jgi:hypothetical protein